MRDILYTCLLLCNDIITEEKRQPLPSLVLLFGWNVQGEKNDPMSSGVMEASLLSQRDMFRSGRGGGLSGYFWLSVSLSKSGQQAKHADEGEGRGGGFCREREGREIETLLGWRTVSFTSTQLLLENSAPCPTKPPGMT